MLRKSFVSVIIRLRVKARENPFRFEMMYRTQENPTNAMVPFGQINACGGVRYRIFDAPSFDVQSAHAMGIDFHRFLH